MYLLATVLAFLWSILDAPTSSPMGYLVVRLLHPIDCRFHPLGTNSTPPPVMMIIDDPLIL